jgi:hypothetical protein
MKQLRFADFDVPYGPERAQIRWSSEAYWSKSFLTVIETNQVANKRILHLKFRNRILHLKGKSTKPQTTLCLSRF